MRVMKMNKTSVDHGEMKVVELMVSEKSVINYEIKLRNLTA